MKLSRITQAITSLVALAGALLLATVGSAQVAARTSSLSGAVLADSGDVPIANAEIVIENLGLSARSDTRGNFQISNVPTGPHRVTVRQLGYEAYTAVITFPAAQKVEADFIMKPVVTKLAKVDVKATVNSRYAKRLQDFEERRRFGTGRFLTADLFEQSVGQNMSQVIVSRIPGVRTVGQGTEQVLVSRRGDRDECRVQIIVNGMVRYNARLGDQRFDLNSVYTGDVIGFEYYSSAQTPAQFSGTSGTDGGSICGTAVIWTK